MGPRISVPAQNSRIAVDSPLDSSELPEILPTARSKDSLQIKPCTDQAAQGQTYNKRT